MVRLLLVSLVVVFGLTGLTQAVGCGGTSAVEEQVLPEVSNEPAVVSGPDIRIWYVFWEGIHSLTIYPEPGPIRAYVGGSTRAPWGTQNRNFAVMSTYVDREDAFGAVIAASATLEELLERLAAMDRVEIDEAVNPAYQ